MKTLIPLLCTLVLIGCNDNPPSEQNPPLQDATTITANQNSVAEVVAVPAEEPITTKATLQSVDKIKDEPIKSPLSKIEKPKKEVEPPVKKVSIPAAIDADAMYLKQCASCHGDKAQKQALGKSQVIAGWSTAQITEALVGYQAGTYGKEMKAVMSGQVKALNAKEIEALANHISKL